MFEDEKKGDVRVTYADISKASRLLNWKPNTELREGLEKEIGWLREAMELGLI